MKMVKPARSNMPVKGGNMPNKAVGMTGYQSGALTGRGVPKSTMPYTSKKKM